MRYFAILSALFVATMTFGQTSYAPIKSSGVVFDVTSGTDTGETITIDGTSYEVLQTEKGSRYITLTSSKSGNDYPLWVGNPTEESYDGRTIYVMSSGSKCVYVVGKSGNPYSLWLKEV